MQKMPEIGPFSQELYWNSKMPILRNGPFYRKSLLLYLLKRGANLYSHNCEMLKLYGAPPIK